jgi:thioredoxin 2
MSKASFIVRCLSCGTGNRIPAEKEGARGLCGNCKAILPPLYFHPQHLNESTFDSFIRAYPGPVLAEFWAPW